MHGLSVKSNTRGSWDWEAAASLYDYARDIVRAQVPNAAAADAGRITDQHGTGWNTLALKGIWRPQGPAGEHVAEFGAQRDAFKLRTTRCRTRPTGSPTASAAAPASHEAFAGRTSLASLWGQDAWRFAPGWKTVLGARLEHWRADDGAIADATTTRSFAPHPVDTSRRRGALS